MAFTANGLSGEVVVGGRTAVRLGRWKLNSVGGGFSCEAAVAESDEYLIQMPSGRTLKLFVGQKLWIWRNVRLEVAGDQVTITGDGRMKVQDR